MYKNYIFVFLILSGFVLINAYIYWIGTKIVPFTHSIAVDKEQTYSFTADKLYPGNHNIILYFMEKSDSDIAIRNMDKNLVLSCKIFDIKNNKEVFQREYDIKKMIPTRWGIKYVPGFDIGYEIDSANLPDEEVKYFKPDYFKKYSFNVDIVKPSSSLSNFDVKLGLFCFDIDDGYYGIQYIVFNLLFSGIVGLALLIAWIIKIRSH